MALRANFYGLKKSGAARECSLVEDFPKHGEHVISFPVSGHARGLCRGFSDLSQLQKNDKQHVKIKTGLSHEGLR